MSVKKIAKSAVRFAARAALRRSKGEAARVRCSAVIVAAGSATRMQGTDKIFVPLRGIPVVVRSCRAYQNCEEIDEIILVVKKDDLERAAELCHTWGITKLTKVVAGGNSRTESVLHGVEAASALSDVIAVHDGARPLVTEDVIRAAVRKASVSGAAIAQVPVTDTVKTHKNGVVTGTPDRKGMCLVQTPQAFNADMFRAVLDRCIKERWEVTDDASAVELCGLPVALTDGNPENIKITTPVDLIIAGAILDGRDEG